MSKIVAYFEFSDMTSKEYDAIINELKKRGWLKNANRPSHVAFDKNGSWCVVDVWESQEALMDFAGNHLIPIFNQLGITPPQPMVFPVHNYID